MVCRPMRSSPDSKRCTPATARRMVASTRLGDMIYNACWRNNRYKAYPTQACKYVRIGFLEALPPFEHRSGRFSTPGTPARSDENHDSQPFLGQASNHTRHERSAVTSLIDSACEWRVRVAPKSATVRTCSGSHARRWTSRAVRLT